MRKAQFFKSLNHYLDIKQDIQKFLANIRERTRIQRGEPWPLENLNNTINQLDLTSTEHSTQLKQKILFSSNHELWVNNIQGHKKFPIHLKGSK